MNRLATEASPYLRQHQDNPVDWYPWGDDAFAAAAERDVPILLSIGYSSCHWCHVMAHECFEHDDVAAAMNAAFVNVKVDREERPDVDAIYMDAVQAMTGRGGWPMTVFLTPTGEPFYGGTYFPRDSFLQLLDQVGAAWRDKRDELTKNTGQLHQAIDRTNRAKAADMPSENLIPATVAGLVKAFDTEHAGFGKAPKFPSTANLELVLGELLRRPPDDQVVPTLTAVVGMSLDAMSSGGIYDHIGGGFSRYSVDEQWLVPHFEKMLYDQALLVRLYTRAAAGLRGRFDTNRWVQTVAETVDFVLRELRLPGGAFGSALDADSKGPDGNSYEGLFYTWNPAEIRAILGEEAAPAALEWWNITDEGNFTPPGLTARSIPNRLHQRGQVRRSTELNEARRRLFAARSQRPKPALDDKVVTEWNALMIGALAEAGALFNHQPWIDAAKAAAEFLLDNLRDDDRRWFRTWHTDGTPPARHWALAADHAALLDAFTRLGEASGEARFIYEAMDVADALLDSFWDPSEGGLYTTPDYASALIARQKDLFDSATPSANSTAAIGLLRLAALTDEQRYANHADRILSLIGPLVPQGASAFTQALAALSLRTHGITEVVIAGDRPDLLAVARERWRPDMVLAWGEPYDSPLWEGRDDDRAYVCERFACQDPQSTPEGLRSQLAPPAPSAPSAPPSPPAPVPATDGQASDPQTT